MAHGQFTVQARDDGRVWMEIHVPSTGQRVEVDMVPDLANGVGELLVEKAARAREIGQP